MKVAIGCAVAALVVLGACASSQPVPVSGNDLAMTMKQGLDAKTDKGTVTFYGDTTASMPMAGSNDIADGSWRVDGDKLCVTWKSPAMAESCGTLSKVGAGYMLK